MVGSLSNLADNLAERVHKTKCTNCKICCLLYRNDNDDLIEYKCLCRNDNYQKRLMKT